MNYDNYYKKGGMTKEESISAIALRIGARKDAVEKFVEEHKIDTNKLNSDLKSGDVYFMDVITAIVGKPNNKYQKEVIKKYGNKMAMGGKTQGYDDREDERLSMEYGKISGKDFVGSHDRREHSRRDDARFEERMEKGGKLYTTQMNVGRAKYVLNYHDGSKTHKDGSPFYDIDIFSNRKDFDKAVKKLESEGYKYRYADGGMMADGGETERDKNGMLYALTEHVSSGEIASKTNASKYVDIDQIRSKAIQYYVENGDKPYSYAELESVLKKFDHTKMANGGAIENQYKNRSAQDIWESWTQHQKFHFLTDHKQHPYYNMGKEKFVVTNADKEIYMNMSYEELPKMVKLMISDHVEEGEYEKGGRLKEEDDSLLGYEPYFEKDVPIAFIDRENKIVRPTSGYYPKHPMSKKAINWAKKHGYDYIADGKKYADGGDIDDYLPAQNKFNKKVLQEINKADINTKLEMGQVVVSALTDANFHSETRKFISILENKPEWEKEPKLDWTLPFEKLEEAKSKTVYASKYYDATDAIEQAGRNIAFKLDWEFEPIVESLKYASQMKGLHTIANALEKLDVSDNSKNEWKYTDVDDIEYVIVKDKSGKELKFDGKYVISGVHDLLEKGGKLTEIGKYFSKNDVVSVVVNGKNILDKNTVSGVWIKKDAKPMAEDVADIKIGKTTLKKGVNGWVAKTMVDNFKGFDWDITTIKNSRGDLTTTAQGGKSEDKGGYKTFTFMLYQDPAIRLKSSRPARVTDKVVSAQHEEAMKDFKERQDEIAEMVDQIQAKKKMADGGAIGFDALAKKVAKNYEGDKVKKQYQKEYGKTYDKQEAEEVGKKVAAKVYRQQQAKGKMAKGGTTNNRSNSKMTQISRKASEIRKANESWRDAFNRAKAMIG